MKNPFKKTEDRGVNEEVHLDLDKPIEEVKKSTKGVRCPDCPKPGLKDDYTLCSTCKGTGLV